MVSALPKHSIAGTGHPTIAAMLAKGSWQIANGQYLSSARNTLDALMSFEKAVQRAQEDVNHASFAFLPKARAGGVIVGGAIFTLLSEVVEGRLVVSLFSDSGYFGTATGDEDCHSIDQLDDDASYMVRQYGIDPRVLLYKQCSRDLAVRAMNATTEYALCLLNGAIRSTTAPCEQPLIDWPRWLMQHLPAEGTEGEQS